MITKCFCEWFLFVSGPNWNAQGLFLTLKSGIIPFVLSLWPFVCKFAFMFWTLMLYTWNRHENINPYCFHKNWNSRGWRDSNLLHADPSFIPGPRKGPLSTTKSHLCAQSKEWLLSTAGWDLPLSGNKTNTQINGFSTLIILQPNHPVLWQFMGQVNPVRGGWNTSGWKDT